MFGLGKAKKDKKTNKNVSVVSEEKAEVKEDNSIPDVPRFTIDDYDEKVGENKSLSFAELQFSTSAKEEQIDTILNFLRLPDEERDAYVQEFYNKDSKWELGNASSAIVVQNAMFLIQRTPRERTEDGVYKSVQTMVNFLSQELNIGVNEINAVEFFPNPESIKSHRIFINKSRLDKKPIGNKKVVLERKAALKENTAP